MIVNNSYGIMKFNNNSMATFIYNTSAENATDRVIFKSGMLKNIPNLKTYQFDKQQGRVYIGDNSTVNISEYGASPVYDGNGTITNVTWWFIANFTPGYISERFDFRNYPLVLYSNSTLNSNLG